MIGTQEILLILLIILILFGGKKLPELARGLGHSLREFKKASHDVDEVKENIKKEFNEAEPDKTK